MQSGLLPLMYAGISVQAAETFTDTAQGTRMNFTTTPTGMMQPVVRLTVSSNGNVGIGTFGPASNLEVSNATNTAPFGGILTTTFSVGADAFSGSLYIGRKARGTSGAPTAAQNGDTLAAFLGEGYGATAFSFTGGGMSVQAAENWTDTARGSARLSFNTTATGTTDPESHEDDSSMRPAIWASALLTPHAPLEVSRTGTNAGVVSTLYANGADAGAFLVAQTARGTAAAPLAIQTRRFPGRVTYQRVNWDDRLRRGCRGWGGCG